MIRIRISQVLPAVGALLLLAGTLHGHQGMAVQPPAAGIAYPASVHGVTGSASGSQDRIAQAGQPAAPARSAPVRVLRVLRVANPRPGPGLHMTFPRTWRPMTLEVGSPAPRPPLRMPCETCRTGNVLEADL